MLFGNIYRFRNPNWWRRRTGLERALTLISIVCSLALVVLIISLISVILNDKAKDGEKNFYRYKKFTLQNVIFQ